MQEDTEIELFYHYCSNETFLNIFNTQTFRLNDCLTTNDSKEMKIFVDGFETFLLEEFQKENFKIFADTFITPREKKLWAEEALKYYFQQWKDFVLNSVALFLLCFTTKNDDLSQWHMYADNAYGINIGLTSSCFEDLCERNKGKGFEFIKVEYISPKTVVDIQKQLAIELCEDLKKLFAKTPELDAPNRSKYANPAKYNTDRKSFNLIRRETRKKVHDIFNKLLFKGILYKDKAFSHEEEWRMDYYIDIKLGPKNPNTRYSIENFLGTSTNFDFIDVSKSKIPFV